MRRHLRRESATRGDLRFRDGIVRRRKVFHRASARDRREAIGVSCRRFPATSGFRGRVVNKKREPGSGGKRKAERKGPKGENRQPIEGLTYRADGVDGGPAEEPNG